MKAGLLAAAMSRRAGGLFPAMRELAQHLLDDGVDVEVFAGRDAYSEQDRSAWGAVPVHVNTVRGPAVFGYQPGLRCALQGASLDIMHLHGLWMYPSLAALSWSDRRHPRIISPHGMLDPWAVRNAGWKKRIVSALYETANLATASSIHALCAAELKAIRHHGLKGPVAVLPNGVDLSIADTVTRRPGWTDEVPDGAKVMLFLGRIHPKKGLAVLFHAMALLGDKGACGNWHLVVAGWDEGGHAVELQALSRHLRLEPRIHFVGPQFGGAKAATMAAADAFILPSLSEGLPMAVLEAWAFARPVLMTPACNLPEGFAAGAALPIGTDTATIADGLRALAEVSALDLQQMGARGRQLVEAKFSWPKIAQDMRALYAWILGGGQHPDFVELA